MGNGFRTAPGTGRAAPTTAAALRRRVLLRVIPRVEAFGLRARLPARSGARAQVLRYRCSRICRHQAERGAPLRNGAVDDCAYWRARVVASVRPNLGHG